MARYPLNSVKSPGSIRDESRRDAGLDQRRLVARLALVGGGDVVRSGDVGDLAVAMVDQVGDGLFGRGRVVDVDGRQCRVAADHDGRHAIGGDAAGKWIADDAGREDARRRCGGRE